MFIEIFVLTFMISVITGSLNRLNNIKNLVANTVEKNDFLELVIIDGGSKDGTLEYINEINNPNIKLIEYGKKSSYPHFMNLGIKNSNNEYICQWNDDALLINKWDDVKKVISEKEYDFHIFNWKLSNNLKDYDNNSWQKGNQKKDGWFLEDKTNNELPEKIVTMNYGIYNRNIFREIGLFDTRFDFWYADGDLSNRAFYFGYKHKSHKDIKVFVFDTPKTRKFRKKDPRIYYKNLKLYQNNSMPRGIELLQ